MIKATYFAIIQFILYVYNEKDSDRIYILYEGRNIQIDNPLFVSMSLHFLKDNYVYSYYFKEFICRQGHHDCKTGFLCILLYVVGFSSIYMGMIISFGAGY